MLRTLLNGPARIARIGVSQAEITESGALNFAVACNLGRLALGFQPANALTRVKTDFIGGGHYADKRDQQPGGFFVRPPLNRFRSNFEMCPPLARRISVRGACFVYPEGRVP